MMGEYSQPSSHFHQGNADLPRVPREPTDANVAYELKEFQRGAAMKRTIELSELETFVKNFNERHEARPVALRLIHGTTPMTEGEGIPLVGLDVERGPSGAIEVEIVLGDDENRHLTHRVRDVGRVEVEMEKGNRETRLIVESRAASRPSWA
jgi:hypothetical protein